MSIQSEIERIKANIASTYSALSARGATMPAEQNSDNLAETVNTVTGGEGGGTAEGAVLYTEQTLTDEQQKQARTNIGAASEVEIEDSLEAVSLTFSMALPEALAWDGVLGDKSVVEIYGLPCVKVSEGAPPFPVEGAAAEIGLGLHSPYFAMGGSPAAQEEGAPGIWYAHSGTDSLIPAIAFIVTADEYDDGEGNVLTKGTYFLYFDIGDQRIFTSYLHVHGYSYADKTVPEVEAPVQSDWNQTDETAADYVKNKPFYLEYGDTLVWDGLATGRVCVDDVLYKASDAVPTIEDLGKGGRISVNFETLEFEPGEVTADSAQLQNGVVVLGEFIFCVPPEAAGVFTEELDLTFPEPGTYFLRGRFADGTFWVTHGLQLNGYTGFASVKQNPACPMPGSVVLWGGRDGYLYDSKRFAYTDDVSSRITTSQLESFVLSGRQMYVCVETDGASGVRYLSPTEVMVYPEVGVVRVGYNETGAAFFTAEYATQTQEVTE